MKPEVVHEEIQQITYIYLDGAPPIVRTLGHGDNVNVDLNAAGDVVGIEIIWRHTNA